MCHHCSLKVCIFDCVFTSVSVEHGYIQVCRSGVDNVLFQSLTSKKIFSNRERGEKWLRTQAHIYSLLCVHSLRSIQMKNREHQNTQIMHAVDTYTHTYIKTDLDRQSLSHKDTNSHSQSTLVLLYIQYSTLFHPIFFIFTPLTHKIHNTAFINEGVSSL